MNIPESAIKAGKTLFSCDCGYTDTRHKVNLAHKSVPESLLREVENGCSIETLESIAAAFPICKYQTQITIHGKFPALATNKVGGYVNLVRNKNKSVGIRWTAIDHEKRERLFNTAHVCAGWYVRESSTAFYIEKIQHITQDNAQMTLDAFRAELDRINAASALFQGGGDIYKCSYWGITYLVLRVNINSFYERNFDALASVICNMDNATIQAKMQAHEQAEKDRNEQWERECKERAEQWEKEREQERAAIAEFRAALKLPFPAVYGEHKPKQGDIIAYVTHSERFNRSSPLCVKYRTFKKQVGRLCVYECDENGTSTNKHGKKAQATYKGYLKTA